jgi:hypothetical protein
MCAMTIVTDGPLPGFFMRHCSGPDLLAKILTAVPTEAEARDIFRCAST